MSPALFLKIYNVSEYIYKVDPDYWHRGLLRTLPYAWDHTEYSVVKQRVRDLVKSYHKLEFFSELITLCATYMYERDDLRFPFRSALGHTMASMHKELLKSNDGRLLGSTDLMDRGILDDSGAQVYIQAPSYDLTTTNGETTELSLLVYNKELTCEERYILYNLVVGKQIEEISGDLKVTRMSIYNKIQSTRGKYGR